jgi:hypothetical protein
MLKLLRLFVVLAAAAALALVLTPAANAKESTTLVAPLTAECGAAEESGATGVAVVQIDAATGEIQYRVVAVNLPGTFTAAHIHGPLPATDVYVNLDLPGLNSGFVATGTTKVDPARAAAIVDDPGSFYINVHTTECGLPGAIRGSLG